MTYVRTIIGERAKRARHSQVCSIENRIYTRKWFPFQGEQAHSLLLLLYMLIERRWRRGRQNSLPKQGCNILHRLQVYHLTLTFIIHNKYTSTLYLYTYMHIPIITIALIIMPFIDRFNVRYKLLGTYI